MGQYLCITKMTSYLECLLNDISPHSPLPIHHHHLLKHILHLGYQMPAQTNRQTNKHAATSPAAASCSPYA